MSAYERIGSEVAWSGQIISAGEERFRFQDGAEVRRDKVWHPGAVAILAVDDDHVWLTRQPREIAGLTDSLEIPAGKLDVEGEPLLDAAQRELAEEIGMRAEHWEELKAFYTSVGFCDERITIYLARGLAAVARPETEEDERIEIIRWPLDEIDAAIAQCQDSKSLIALLWLSRAHARGELITG